METIKKGSRGEDVKTLQKCLNVAVDGIFGPITEEAVRLFQKENGLTVDGIVGPKTWAALKIDDTPRKTANNRNIKEIIVHCSATPEGEDFTVNQIRQMHLQRGFNDIGYHWVIYRDGSIHKGRDESIAGAHTTNHNAISVGVCYIGGCPPRTDPKWMNKGKDTRTPQQKQSLLNLLKELKARYPSAKIYGHRDFANKACPSFDAKTEYKDL